MVPYIVRIACGLNGKIRREGYVLTPEDVEDAKRLPPGIIEFVPDEEPVVTECPSVDISEMTVQELRAYAKEHGIAVPSRANRNLLRKLVMEHG